MQKALKCKTADDLLNLAEAEGYEMTRDEAEAYIAEMADYELDDETLKLFSEYIRARHAGETTLRWGAWIEENAEAA